MQFGSNDVAGNLVDLLLIKKFEGVTAADFALEVDRESHHPDIFGQCRFRDVAAGGGAIDRIVDYALRIGKVAFNRANGAESDPSFLRIPNGVDVAPILCGEGKAAPCNAHLETHRERAQAGTPTHRLNGLGSIGPVIPGAPQQCCQTLTRFQAVACLTTCFGAGLLQIHFRHCSCGARQNRLQIGARRRNSNINRLGRIYQCEVRLCRRQQHAIAVNRLQRGGGGLRRKTTPKNHSKRKVANHLCESRPAIYTLLREGA